MFEIISPNTRIDFVGKRKIWMAISILAVLASIVLFFTKGLNYGVDFTGGAEIQIQVPPAWDTEKVRNELDKGGVKDARVQQIGLPEENQYLIKAQGDEQSLGLISGRVRDALSKNLQEGEYQVLRADVVGPAAGRSLRISGFLSLLYSLVVILIYVTIRFDARYSPGLVIALFHDSMIVIGIFVLTQMTFDLQVLAALLALIGYSNNDTIVVFDRVRETSQLHPELTVEEAVNRSVNETMGRTLLTSISTFLVVSALWLFGGKVIHDFAFALMIGIVIGTYSSIFVASSLVITFTHYLRNRETRNKAHGGRKKKAYQVRPEPKFQ